MVCPLHSVPTGSRDRANVSLIIIEIDRVFCGVGTTLSAESADCIYLPIVPSRALSLRNLVSGYECGRVFPAGVGPGSSSRDAAN